LNAIGSGTLSVRSALVWSFAERYASLIVTLASTMLLARLLTPAQIGVFSLCASVTAVAGILRDFGVSEYLNQEKDLTDDKIRAAFGVAIVIAWSIALLILLFRHSVATYYGEPGVADLLAVLSLNFFILPFSSPAFALLSREMAFRKIFVVQILSNAVQSVVAVTLAYRGHGYMSLAWAPVASIAVQTVLVGFFRPRESLLLPGFKAAREVLSYGSMFVASRFIETFTRNAHEFIIAKQVGFAAVGIFSRAFGLIELFNSNVTSAVMRVASPSFATDHRAGIPLKASFARGTAIFTSIAFPFLGFIVLMAADIIHVLFGAQWDAAAPLARILAIALIPFYLIGLAPHLLAATGHVTRRLKISFWFSPVHLLGVLLASFISLQAVAMVWALSNTVMLAMYVFHLKTVLHSTASELFKPSLASVLVASISVSVQALILFLCRELALPTLANLLAVAVAAAIAWLLAVKAIRHPVYDEIARFVEHRRLRARSIKRE
jgi:O-antigen/teichoic acid export membrane protein